MSDEKEIAEVMQDELRAAKGKPPIDRTTRSQKARIKAVMRRAIQECNEADFIAAILDLGHTPGSDEYERMMKLWNERPGGRR